VDNMVYSHDIILKIIRVLTKVNDFKPLFIIYGYMIIK